jgi:hypothetical protein
MITNEYDEYDNNQLIAFMHLAVGLINQEICALVELIRYKIQDTVHERLKRDKKDIT